MNSFLRICFQNEDFTEDSLNVQDFNCAVSEIGGDLN